MGFIYALEKKRFDAEWEKMEKEYIAAGMASEAIEGMRCYNQLLTWADLYSNSSFDAQKMIVSQFIKAVRVGKDYEIDIDFDVSFEEFSRYSAESAEKWGSTMRFASA